MTERLLSPQDSRCVQGTRSASRRLAFAGRLEVQLQGEDPDFREWQHLQQQNSQLVHKTELLLAKLAGLQGRLTSQERYTHSSKPKRHRRTADQIYRDFSCSHCGKAYGSEGSLTQHSRLKHGARGNGGESDRSR